MFNFNKCFLISLLSLAFIFPIVSSNVTNKQPDIASLKVNLALAIQHSNLNKAKDLLSKLTLSTKEVKSFLNLAKERIIYRRNNFHLSKYDATLTNTLENKLEDHGPFILLLCSLGLLPATITFWTTIGKYLDIDNKEDLIVLTSFGSILLTFAGVTFSIAVLDSIMNDNNKLAYDNSVAIQNLLLNYI